MSILADRIEKFILTKLLEDQEPIVVLQRNELADELECAPSQISYVLSTRFSNDRGFIVESRRGLGGFIRITRIPDEAEIKQLESRNAHSKQLIQEESTDPLGFIEQIDEMLYRLMRHSLISKREAALMHEAYNRLLTDVAPTKRRQSVHSLYNAMIQLLKEE